MNKTRFFPPDFKEQTQGLAIQRMPLPKEVILPLSQHTGRAASPQVAVQEKVFVGTPVAAASGYLSVPIHCSVSGTVKNIGLYPHPIAGQAQAIVIESDGKDSLDSAIKDRQDVDALTPEAIRKIIRDCGIVGLGGAAFPTHVKLTPPADKPVDTFIVNGAECEPYLAVDHRLMLEKAEEIIAAAKVAMKVLGVRLAFVAIEENKPDALAVFKKLLDHKTIKLVSIKSFYPQGAEKQLIKVILGKEVPAGGLPFDVGVVVNNVATCLAIYEAVYKNKPLYERVITVSGRIVKRPGNLLVRLGTKVKDIIEFCGGLIKEPAKIIFGGPMMGIAQYTQEVPVIKSTSGIVVLDKQEAAFAEEQFCIRCGACIRACPMGLAPGVLNLASEKKLWLEAKRYRAIDCIECGLCNYVCPAKRNLTQSIKRAKLEITR